jgi:putative transposase
MANALNYHFVFCPKYRKPLFADPKVKAMCTAIFQSICSRRGWAIEAFEIMSDHLHILITLPRIVSVDRVAFLLKGASSHELRVRLPYLKGYLHSHFWASGYFVDTVGKSDHETVRRYIQRQEEAWQGKSRSSYIQRMQVAPIRVIFHKKQVRL